MARDRKVLINILIYGRTLISFRSKFTPEAQFLVFNYMVNKIQKRLLLLTILFLTLGLYFLLRSSSTFAYQCEQSKSFIEEFTQSTVIFVGKITQIAKAEPVGIREGGHSIVFEVQRVYKGELGKTTDIRVDGIGGIGYGSCGVYLKEGETYLVYASGGPLSTNICTRGIGGCNRTTFLKDASEDLTMLGGEIISPTPEDAKEPLDTRPKEPERSEPKTDFLSIEVFLVGFIMLIIGILIGRAFSAKKLRKCRKGSTE